MKSGKGSLLRNAVYLGIGLASTAVEIVTSRSQRRSQWASEKVVVITGESRGLGLALAGEFGRRGARIGLAARDEAELSRARSQLLERGLCAVPRTFAGDSRPARLINGSTRRSDILVVDGGAMSRISKLDRSEVTPDLATLFDKVFAQRGNVPNMFRVMAHRPEIFATMQAHFGAVLNTGTVSTKLKELIIVRTSQVNETPYCLASHTILAKGLGWSDDQLAHLAEWPKRDDFTAAEKAALRLAETVTRDAHTVSDEQYAELRSFYSEGEIVELLCAIGLFNYFNRFNNALRMEPTKPGEGGCAAQAEHVAETAR